MTDIDDVSNEHERVSLPLTELPIVDAQEAPLAISMLEAPSGGVSPIGSLVGRRGLIWKPVPGFPGYEVSEYGHLCHDGYELKPEFVQGNGRKRFSLSKSGTIVRLKAAQIVALAFLGPQPFDGAEVCHEDGFKTNDHYSNLRWDTHKANMADTVRHAIERKERAGIRVSKRDRLSAMATAFIAAASQHRQFK